MKVTFKKRPKETGLRAVGYPYQNVDIKLGGKVFGLINAPTWQTKDNFWRVSFAAKAVEENKDWRWATFVPLFENEELAREWVIANVDRLAEKYQFHFFDN